jgi:hypothetical protein
MKVYSKTLGKQPLKQKKEAPGEQNTDDYMCCCKPHLEHNELNKLILLFKDGQESRGNVEVFPQHVVDKLPAGKVDIGDSKFSYTLGHSEVNLQGQNMMMHELLAKRDKGYKVIYMYGPKDSGKSHCCQFFLNYCEARDRRVKPCIKPIANNCPHGDTSWPLFTSIKRETNDPDLQYIYVLDDADKMLSDRWESFRAQMAEYLKKPNVFFIVTYSNKELQGKIAAKIHINIEDQVPVGALLNKDAARYIIKHARQKLPFNARNPDELATHVFPEKYYKMSLVRSLLTSITTSDEKIRSLSVMAQKLVMLKEKENDAAGVSRPSELKEEFKELMK